MPFADPLTLCGVNLVYHHPDSSKFYQGWLLLTCNHKQHVFSERYPFGPLVTMVESGLHFAKVYGLFAFLHLLGNIDCVCAQSVRRVGSEFQRQPLLHRDLNTEYEVGQIENIYLINADADRPIRLLQNGDVINIANRASSDFNIEARTTNGTVGSVTFGYEFLPKYRTENVPPFAFCGNNKVNYHVCGLLGNGQHTVTATPFLYKDAQGPAGETLEITFTIVDRTPRNTMDVPTNAPTDVPTRRPTMAPYKSCELPQVCVV